MPRPDLRTAGAPFRGTALVSVARLWIWNFASSSLAPGACKTKPVEVTTVLPMIDQRLGVHKMWGPYWTRSDPKRPRQFVVLELANGEKKTTSYARFLMECSLGRWLNANEHVDHIDENCANDDLANLRILTPRQNWERTRRPIELYFFWCPVCGTAASKPAARVRHNQQKQGKLGPYCSRHCAAVAKRRDPENGQKPFDPAESPQVRTLVCPQGHVKDGWHIGPKGRRYPYCKECNRQRSRKSRSSPS